MSIFSDLVGNIVFLEGGPSSSLKGPPSFYVFFLFILFVFPWGIPGKQDSNGPFSKETEDPETSGSMAPWSGLN